MYCYKLLKKPILSLTLTFLFLCFPVSNAFGQTCSAYAAHLRAGWRAGSNVSVYIPPTFQGPARDAVRQAFTNWNTANMTENPSRVHYNFVDTPPTDGTGITVEYVSIIPDANGNNRTRATVSTSTDDDGFTTGARIQIHNSMTDPAALLETTSHEIGHPAGFGHCSCGRTESVMSTVGYDPSSPASMNTAYGRATSPTVCDNYRMQEVYGSCSLHAEKNCTNNGGTFNIPMGGDCTCSYPGGGGGGGLTYCEMYPSQCGGGGGGGYGGPTCYHVYEERWTQTCVDGDCGPREAHYEYAGMYCY